MSGNLTLKNTVIQGNLAQGRSGVGSAKIGGAAEGGGVYVTGSSTVGINGGSISGNSAIGGAGGAGGTFASQGVSGGNADGGGVFVIGPSTISINGGSISNNGAIGGVGGQGGNGRDGSPGGTAGNAEGGAIYTKSPTSLLNSSLIQNIAAGGQGGSGGAGGNGGDAGSGKLPPPGMGATGGSGGDGGDGASGSPGTGTANGGGVFLTGSNPDSVFNTTFGLNSAAAGNGGLGGAKGLGGLNTDSVVISGRTRARNGNDGFIGTAGTANGGGTYATVAARNSFVNDTFYGNSATTQGGGIFTKQSKPNLPLLVNTILENNYALDGPDYSGDVNTGNAFDFVSIGDISQWFIGAGAKPLAGTIVNVNTPQLENTLSSAPLPGGGSSPYFYRLLPGSLVVNGGTATVLHDIAVAERAAGELLLGSSDTAAVDETLTALRTFDSGNLIDMGAVQFFTANSTLNVSFIPASSFAVPINTTSVSVQVLVTQGTNPGNLPINGGTVTFNLQQGNTLVGTVTANVSSIGIASATIPLPMNLPPGSYTITASYANANGGPANPHGTFASTATATLTIAQPPTPPPPVPPTPPPLPSQVASLELAIDTAALLLQGNLVALLKLQLLANVLLQYQVPTTLPALVQSFQSLTPQAGNLALASIEAGISLAQSLQ